MVIVLNCNKVFYHAQSDLLLDEYIRLLRKLVVVFTIRLNV